MLNIIFKILLISLFIFIPLINSHLIDLLGIKWGFYVDGNYEFTKVIFFNILSGIILTLFFLKSYLNNKIIKIPKILIYVIGILFLSTIFSDYSYTSFLGNTSKGHNLIMFLNLIGLFIVFLNQDKKFNKKLILITIISSILVGIIGIKEYYFPTFDYGNLSNRAISTFGHPNYLALFILILIPFLINKIKYDFYKIVLILLIILLFLTKSIWGILIFLIYIGFILYLQNKEKINKKYLIFFVIISIFLIGIISYEFGLLTKLNSFISRFYIWETILNIIFSDIKNVILGSGIATLDLVFNLFKSPELYVYENIGFKADRAHNLLLNLFYNFGIFGLIFILFLIYKLIKSYKNNPYYHSIVLFILFTIFNFGGVTHYLIIILIISIIYNSNDFVNKIIINNIIILLIITSSIFGVVFSYNYYENENNKYLNNNYITTNVYIKYIEYENKKNSLLYGKNLSVIEYFYLGNINRINNKKIAIIYYKEGLKLLPDMRNSNSEYYNNYFMKTLFIPERFYSKKFSNLEEILKRIGIKITTKK